MPLISYFYGIKIYMQYNDHNPPHIHVIYGEFSAVFFLKEDKVEGKVPPRVEKLVKEWMKEHKEELLEDWNLAQEHKILNSIDPLV